MALNVLSVAKLPERSWWEYKGKRFPTLNALIRINDEEIGVEFSTVSLDDLLQVAFESSLWSEREEARYIDEHIYGYLDDENFEMSNDELREYIAKEFD